MCILFFVPLILIELTAEYISPYIMKHSKKLFMWLLCLAMLPVMLVKGGLKNDVIRTRV